MISSALLPIGGKGTRMSLYSDTPKLLLSLGSKNLLSLSIDALIDSGVSSFYFLSNLASNSVNNFAAEYCSAKGVDSTFLFESKLSGNFGCILENIDSLPDTFIVSYPDVVHSIDLQKVYKYFYASQSDILFVCRKSNHLHDSDKIAIDCLDRVLFLDSKISPLSYESNYYNLYGNCGIYVASKSFVRSLYVYSSTTSSSIDLFQLITSCSNYIKLFNISPYISSDYILDVGTPARFESAKAYLSTKLPPTRYLLLDRDGTLVNSVDGYLLSADQVMLNTKLLETYRRYTSDGYIPVVISNQPQISFGLLSLRTLDQVNSRIQYLLRQYDLREIYRFLHCPHHPHHGFPDETTYLKHLCLCRKPSTGMIDILNLTCNVSPSSSIMIGNTDVDMLFAKNFGCRYIDVNTLS